MNARPLRSFGGDPARVLVVGGGVAGIELLPALRALAKERVSIEVLSPAREFVYRPLSVLEPFGAAAAPAFDVERIAIDQGAHFRRDALAEVDAESNRVRAASGVELGYDVLVVAVGARQAATIEGAIVFNGPSERRRFADVLARARRGSVRRVVFAVPSGFAWALPLYELALNTAHHLEANGAAGVKLTLVTPEDLPLGVFGPPASNAVRDLLDERGIELRTGVYPASFDGQVLSLVPDGGMEADEVVALPALRGPALLGLPHDEDGFVPVDEHCLVHGSTNVYAAGDTTSFPLKHGGIAAEQADAAAEAIAARVGARITPRPFRPVLRGQLLTPEGPRFLSARITRGPAIQSEVDVEPLWWPAAKIPGRYIGRYLDEQQDLAKSPLRPAAAG
jgi:sulfide:quinone oxidoreductase